jgi:hypothetical protein
MYEDVGQDILNNSSDMETFCQNDATELGGGFVST